MTRRNARAARRALIIRRPYAITSQAAAAFMPRLDVARCHLPNGAPSQSAVRRSPPSPTVSACHALLHGVTQRSPGATHRPPRATRCSTASRSVRPRRPAPRRPAPPRPTRSRSVLAPLRPRPARSRSVLAPPRPAPRGHAAFAPRSPAPAPAPRGHAAFARRPRFVPARPAPLHAATQRPRIVPLRRAPPDAVTQRSRAVPLRLRATQRNDTSTRYQRVFTRCSSTRCRDSRGGEGASVRRLRGILFGTPARFRPRCRCRRP
jgi:hypothetical protein